jgi:hypothetical protein
LCEYSEKEQVFISQMKKNLVQNTLWITAKVNKEERNNERQRNEGNNLNQFKMYTVK